MIFSNFYIICFIISFFLYLPSHINISPQPLISLILCLFFSIKPFSSLEKSLKTFPHTSIFLLPYRNSTYASAHASLGNYGSWLFGKLKSIFTLTRFFPVSKQYRYILPFLARDVIPIEFCPKTFSMTERDRCPELGKYSYVVQIENTRKTLEEMY